MAGDWIKWKKGLVRRHEVLGIAARMGIAPTQAAGLCMLFWEWCDENVAAPQIDKNGDAFVALGALQPAFIDALVGAPGFANALAAEGWLRLEGGSFTIPNYSRHNSETGKARALAAERMRQSRRRKRCAPSVTRVTRKASPEKRREEKSNTSPKGDVTPLPPSLPSELRTDEFAAAWADWLRHRREIRKPLKPTAAAHKLRQLAAWGSARAVAAIRHSLGNGWQGIFEADAGSAGAGPARSTGRMPSGPGQVHPDEGRKF